MDARPFALALCLLLAACTAGAPEDPPHEPRPTDGDATAQAVADPTADEELPPWVCVATYTNPSLSEEGARASEALFDALEAADIECVSAGSRGFSLCVLPGTEERAREIVAATIEAEGLEAWLFE